jgi:hypothetical protein
MEKKRYIPTREQRMKQAELRRERRSTRGLTGEPPFTPVLQGRSFDIRVQPYVDVMEEFLKLGPSLQDWFRVGHAEPIRVWGELTAKEQLSLWRQTQNRGIVCGQTKNMP